MRTLPLFFGCVAIWGTTWLAITFQLGAVAPEVSVAYRFLLAAILIAGYCRLRGLSLGYSAAEHLALAALGLSMYSVGYICVYRAELHVVSGLVAVAYSASPLLAMLGMRLVFGQPMSWRVGVGSVLGILGIALVFWPEFGQLRGQRDMALGSAYTVAAVVISTIGSLVAHRNHQRRLTGWPSMAWSMGYGGALALLVALALGRSLTVELSWGYAFSLLYLAVFGSVLAFAGYLTLLGRIGAARASYIGVMVPIVALVISSVFEHFTWHALTFAGTAISVAGNVLVLRRTG